MDEQVEKKRHDVTEKLQHWFCQKLPEATQLTIDNLISPDIGYSSETVLFDLSYRMNEQLHTESLVIRLEPQGIPLFSHYDLHAQYRIMDTLSSSDIPVPKMRWFEHDCSLFGGPFYIMNKVDGRVPADNPPYHMVGMLKDKPEEELRKLWCNALDTMAKIHRLEIEHYDLAFLDGPELGDSPIKQHIKLYENHIAWGLDSSRFPLLDTALTWLYKNLPEAEPIGLTWGDARICNMIFRDSECVAVLDWEMSRLGNPVQDLGYWLVLDSCMSEGIGIQRLPGTLGEAETISHWEKTSGRSASALDFYKIFAAFTFTCIMARVITREKMQGNVPEEDNFDVDNLASQKLAQLLREAGVAETSF